MNPELKISVVLGSYNRKKFLKFTINSVRDELEDQPYELIVIDGGSNDGTAKWLAKQKDVITIIQHNHGSWRGKKMKRHSWGYFMNLGFKIAQGKYICMLSDDCLVVPGAIRNGYNLFEKKLNKNIKIGALAFYWRNWPKEKEYKVGLTLGNRMFVNHGMYLKKALDEVSYIDEKTFKFYHADGDLCLKLWQQGYICLDSPNSYIEHHAHANRKVRSSNTKISDKDWGNYLKKWTGIFYHPELNDYGKWIKKNYEDIHKTVSKFKSSFLKIF